MHSVRISEISEGGFREAPVAPESCSHGHHLQPNSVLVLASSSECIITGHSETDQERQVLSLSIDNLSPERVYFIANLRYGPIRVALRPNRHVESERSFWGGSDGARVVDPRLILPEAPPQWPGLTAQGPVRSAKPTRDLT